MGIMDKIVDGKMYYEFAMRNPQSLERFLERAREDKAKAEAIIIALEKAKKDIEANIKPD